MTTIAAPPRRVRAGTRSSVHTGTRRPPARVRRSPPSRAKVAPRAATRALAIGRVGGLLAVVTIFAVVTAVVFHVVLAQNQLQLDRLNGQIASEQRTYEQRRLTASLLASPPQVIQRAEHLGLVMPAEPAEYLYVEKAPMPRSEDGATADTIADWSKTKASLGTQQP